MKKTHFLIVLLPTLLLFPRQSPGQGPMPPALTPTPLSTTPQTTAPQIAAPQTAAPLTTPQIAALQTTPQPTAPQTTAPLTTPQITALQTTPQPTTPQTTPQPTPPQIATPQPAPAPYTIRVLCLYGSVPAKGFMGKEPMYGPNNLINRAAKLRGGHVGVEYEPDKVLSFQPLRYTGIAHAGHLISNSNHKNFNSCFRIYTERRMWNVLGNYYNNLDSLRRAVFVIPVTAAQKYILDSLATAYTTSTPYD